MATVYCTHGVVIVAMPNGRKKRVCVFGEFSGCSEVVKAAIDYFKASHVIRLEKTNSVKKKGSIRKGNMCRW